MDTSDLMSVIFIGAKVRLLSAVIGYTKAASSAASAASDASAAASEECKVCAERSSN